MFVHIRDIPEQAAVIIKLSWSEPMATEACRIRSRQVLTKRVRSTKTNVVKVSEGCTTTLMASLMHGQFSDIRYSQVGSKSHISLPHDTEHVIPSVFPSTLASFCWVRPQLDNPSTFHTYARITRFRCNNLINKVRRQQYGMTWWNFIGCL